MRLFVALDIPDETREELACLVTQFKPKYPAAQWVRPEAMHITLKFIGHTMPGSLTAIRDALANVRSPRPMEIHFRGLGFFPSEKRPRVFWCGTQASPNAGILAADLDRALAKLGVGAETRPFAPHLTLARFKGGAVRGKQSGGPLQIVDAARKLQARDFGALRTSEFHLFESTTRSTGAEYTKLSTFHFTEAAS